MSTIRERVRAALGAREPGETEARADLDAILQRVDGKRRPRTWVLAPALVLAGAIGWLALRGPAATLPSTPTAVAVATSVAAEGDVHVFIQVVGEPAERALQIDLTSKGISR